MCVFRDAGHILGSSIVEIFITGGGTEKKLVFQAILGQQLRGVTFGTLEVERSGRAIVESTYGDRNHRPYDETLESLKTS